VIGFPGVEQVYDPRLTGLERAYVRLFGVPVNGLRIRLRHVLPATRGTHRRILDAGCGIGVFTMELAKRHPDAEVIGVDFEDELVKRANLVAQRAGLANCRFRTGDVTELGLDSEFDLVVSVDNLEHVQDDVLALANLRRALVPGGRLVVHVPGYYRRWLLVGKRVNFDVPGHMRPGYLAEDLVAKMQAAGLVVEDARHTYGVLETFTNNLSYLITGAERRNRQLYALVFPFLLAGSYLGRWSRPSWGAGLLAVAHRSDAKGSL
jgi:2-polyprenyl-3-methyl-5-hydroxy-6-metoxy-1,4-benzoquinol methylase